MKVRTDVVLKSLSGEDLISTNDEGVREPITFRTIAVNALLDNSRKTDGIEKLQRGMLAEQIYQSAEIDLDEKQVAKIKELVYEMYPPLIILRMSALLKV